MHCCALLLALTAGTSAISPDSLQVRYVGNAGVEIYDGQTTLLVDLPYESGAFGLMTYEPDSIRARGRVASVVTHGHEDHFSRALFTSRDWSIVGPQEVTRSLPAARVVEGERATIGEFGIQRIRTTHADVEHYSYLVTWRGRRLYFVGDTEDPSAVLAARDLDVVFLTPWLSCAIEEAGGIVQARRVVLYHQMPREPMRVCGQPDNVGQGGEWWLSPAEASPTAASQDHGAPPGG